MKNKRPYKQYLEEALEEYFGCDPAYYKEEEVIETERILEIGYKHGKPKWKKIEECTPEEDTQVLCCLSNKWSKEIVKYSVLKYFQNNWYGDITEDEKVEEFMEIPQ